MTLPDRTFERPLEPPETQIDNTQDVVYAPASERVPRTVADYRDVVEQTDTHTPERQAVATAEPSFARVPRPSDAETQGQGQSSGQNWSAESQGWSADWEQNRWVPASTGGLGRVPMGIGWLTLGMCGGAGVWLWLRRRREHNKPLNRLRRQARQTAVDLRDHMPDLPDLPNETRRAVGVGTALMSLGFLLWQRAQSRSQTDLARARAETASGKAGKLARQAHRVSLEAGNRASKASRQAADKLSDLDWQARLMELRDRWTPGRLELEHVSPLPRR